VAMDPFYKSCAEIDLTSLYYITFIEPLVVSPMKTLFSINKVIEEKIKDHFLLFEEYFFATVLLRKTNYEIQFEDLSPEVLEFFPES
jgi:hypothetical protein